MSQTPKLEDVIEAAIDERLESFWTAVPARVKKFDFTTGTATIEITVANAVEDGKGEKRWYHATVNNVMVLFPGSVYGGIDQYRVTFPIGAGNAGLYVVSTLALDSWRSSNGKTNIKLNQPKGATNHLSSGWFIPAETRGATSSTPQAQADAMVLAGKKVKIGSDTGTSPIATKASLDALYQAIATCALISGTTGAAFAALKTALDNALWPTSHVATKAEAK